MKQLIPILDFVLRQMPYSLVVMFALIVSCRYAISTLCQRLSPMPQHDFDEFRSEFAKTVIETATALGLGFWLAVQSLTHFDRLLGSFKEGGLYEPGFLIWAAYSIIGLMLMLYGTCFLFETLFKPARNYLLDSWKGRNAFVFYAPVVAAARILHRFALKPVRSGLCQLIRQMKKLKFHFARPV